MRFSFLGVTSFPSGSMTLVFSTCFLNEDLKFFKYASLNPLSSCSSCFEMLPDFFFAASALRRSSLWVSNILYPTVHYIIIYHKKKSETILILPPSFYNPDQFHQLVHSRAFCVFFIWNIRFILAVLFVFKSDNLEFIYISNVGMCVRCTVRLQHENKTGNQYEYEYSGQHLKLFQCHENPSWNICLYNNDNRTGVPGQCHSEQMFVTVLSIW